MSQYKVVLLKDNSIQPDEIEDISADYIQKVYSHVLSLKDDNTKKSMVDQNIIRDINIIIEDTVNDMAEYWMQFGFMTKFHKKTTQLCQSISKCIQYIEKCDIVEDNENTYDDDYINNNFDDFLK